MSNEVKERKKRTRRNVAREWADLRSYIEIRIEVLQSLPDDQGYDRQVAELRGILARLNGAK